MIQGGLGHVIRHCKARNYHLAKESLDKTSEASIQDALRDKAVRKDLKKIGVRQRPGCLYPYPYTVYSVTQDLGDMITEKLPPAPASSVPAIHVIGQEIIGQIPVPPGQVPDSRDTLEKTLNKDQQYNIAELNQQRNQSAEQFEDVGLRNRINAGSLDHHIEKMRQRVAHAKTELEQAQIHVADRKIKQEELDLLSRELADLNRQKAGLSADLRGERDSARHRSSDRDRKARLREDNARLRQYLGD